MSIIGDCELGARTRMKTDRMIAMTAALVLSCLSRAGSGASLIGSRFAPPPCVVLQMDPARGSQPPEGSSGGRAREGPREPARAPGSVTVTPGCTLAVWTEEGGYRSFTGGTPVHLNGWDWTSQPLTFHCSCEEEEGIPGPVDKKCKKFMENHLDPKVKRGNDAYCDEKMKMVNKKKWCKGTNTFIHATSEKVIRVCSTKPIKGNLHRSKQSFKLTECNKTESDRKPCNYNATNVTKKIIIGCDDGKPVHFEGTESEGSSIIP